MADIPRLLIAAPASGGGKTTVTCALLRAVQRRGLSPISFKCGPDFIDPLFHTEVVGAPGRNLDLFFLPEPRIRALLARHAQRQDIAVLEGVMGYYDGVGATDRASSWHLAAATDTPVILVLQPRGMALSAAALVKGFLAFRERHRVRGLLLNRCSEKLFRLLAPLLERECGVPVLGYLPDLPDCAIASRHLGLVTAAEVEDLQGKLDRLATAMEACADVERILETARAAGSIDDRWVPAAPVVRGAPVIAVARDEAFCFYYHDNLEMLEEMGARLVPFSPLCDRGLPENTAAVYIGGGYPELYAQRLADNTAMRAAVHAAITGGMPTLAECGGFQYLQERLTDAHGAHHYMVGALDGGSRPAGGLRRFGYLTLCAQRDTVLCKAGEQIPAHEFHHWDSAHNGDACLARRAAGDCTWPCVVAKGNLFAGYPHLYFPGNPEFAEKFVHAAEKYRAGSIG